jgi:2'-5' RNA ligase
VSRTAVVVEVPAAERLVDEWADVSGVARDPGVPAHVTVLYPFVHPAELPDAVERMRRLCSEMAPFVATLTHVGVFPGAVWLAPEPAESFRGSQPASSRPSAGWPRTGVRSVRSRRISRF